MPLRSTLLSFLACCPRDVRSFHRTAPSLIRRNGIVRRDQRSFPGQHPKRMQGTRNHKRAQLQEDEVHEPITDPVQSARSAGLRYVSDRQPGIHRRRSRGGFRYVDPDGAPVRDAATLSRIKSLVIPPAWTDVWITKYENGHLQASGRDARGRKQSRYHSRWREVRDETKYERITHFAEVLPTIRRQLEHDLALPGLPRKKVLATIVSLMEVTHIRVGNAEYARENHSYGLTTMRTRHVEVSGADVTFTFQGKSRAIIRLIFTIAGWLRSSSVAPICPDTSSFNIWTRMGTGTRLTPRT